MMKILPYILAIILSGFALLTLFLSASVILDLFNIRAKEGNYVLFVVWSNFISSFFYLAAAYGFVKSRGWTATILVITTLILIAAFVGLNLHINSGGLYEEKTISAMIFRIAVTFVFGTFAYFTINKKIIKMKVLKFSVITLVLSTFLISCGNTSTNNLSELTVTSIHEEHQPHEENEEIKLNNGQKWIVNDEMKPFLFESDAHLNEYIQEASNDYTTLAAQLKEKNSGLIKSCTMKGESHDELHKWLYPHMGLIEALGNAQNTEEAAVIILELEKSFETYHNYFK